MVYSYILYIYNYILFLNNPIATGDTYLCSCIAICITIATYFTITGEAHTFDVKETDTGLHMVATYSYHLLNSHSYIAIGCYKKR